MCVQDDGWIALTGPLRGAQGALSYPPSGYERGGRSRPASLFPAGLGLLDLARLDAGGADPDPLD